MATTNTRADLHGRIDELPDQVRTETLLYVQALRDGDRLAPRLLSALQDDEEETEEERAAMAEEYADFARGDVVADDDLDREPGW